MGASARARRPAKGRPPNADASLSCNRGFITLISMAAGGPGTRWRNTTKPCCTAAILFLITWHGRYSLFTDAPAGARSGWLVGVRGRGGWWVEYFQVLWLRGVLGGVCSDFLATGNGGSEVGGWSEPGNLNGSCVRDPVAGTLEFD